MNIKCTKCGAVKENPKRYWCKACNRKYRADQRAKNPWESSYYHAKERCENKRHNKYERYGKRGIKFLLSREEIKFLWDRDKAFAMKKASIDRIDIDGHYHIENCRFIERNLNASLGRKHYMASMVKR